MRKIKILATSALIASAGTPLSADAQERIRERLDTERRLDSIEVTAQKQTENLQDVPIAVTAFDAERLETLGIDGFQDLQNFTPGLVASPNPAESSGLRLSIRGIGQDDPQIGFDPTVALYVDGVYVGKTPALTFDNPDLERVEVLKGPQGTLYGRNAVAGAINIITKGAVIGEFGGKAGVELGNFGANEFSGALNVPIGDTVAVKLSGIRSDQDGFIENTGLGDDFGAFTRSAIGLEVAYEPTDGIRVEYGYDYNSTAAAPFFNQPVGPIEPTAFLFNALTTLDGFGPTATPVPPTLDSGRQDSVDSQIPILRGNTETQTHRVQFDWEQSDNHDFRALFAYREADSSTFAAFFPQINPAVLNGVLSTPDPASGVSVLGALSSIPTVLAAGGISTRPDFLLPLVTPSENLFANGPFQTFGASPDAGIPTLDGHEQFSIELTQSGNFGSQFEYTFGFFYLNEDTAAGAFLDRDDDALGLAQLLPSLFILPQIQPTADALTATATDLAIAAATPGTPPETLAALQGQVDILNATLGGLFGGIADIATAARGPGSRIEIETDAIAVFGQVTWTPIEALSITAGLRYSRDEKDGFQQGFSPFFNDTIDLLGNPITPLTGEQVFDSLDPTVIVEYRPIENVLVYGSYIQGFRSGGFNQSSVTLDDFFFDQEDVQSFEGGFKTDFFNNRIRLNGAFFYTELDNQQFTFTNPATPVIRTVANNDARFIGFELDGAVVVSDYLTASFAYAFLDTEADEFTNPFTGELLDDTASNSPRNSVSFNLDYVRPIFNGDLAAHVGFNHKAATNVIGVERTNANVLDARLAYTAPIGGLDNVTLYVFGQNLTDDTFTVDGLDAFTPLIATTQTFGLSRTFGGGVSIAF